MTLSRRPNYANDMTLKWANHLTLHLMDAICTRSLADLGINIPKIYLNFSEFISAIRFAQLIALYLLSERRTLISFWWLVLQKKLDTVKLTWWAQWSVSPAVWESRTIKWKRMHSLFGISLVDRIINTRGPDDRLLVGCSKSAANMCSTWTHCVISSRCH